MEQNISKNLKYITLYKVAKVFHIKEDTIREFLKEKGYSLAENRLTELQYGLVKEYFAKPSNYLLSPDANKYTETESGKTNENIPFDILFVNYPQWYVGRVRRAVPKNQHLGQIETNNLLKDDIKDDIDCTNITFHKDVVIGNNPSVGAWCFFQFAPIGKKRRQVCKVISINQNEQVDWSVILRYVGVYALGNNVSGSCEIIRYFIRKFKNDDLLKTICGYVDQLNDFPSRQGEFIQYILSIPVLKEYIKKRCENRSYVSPSVDSISAFVKIQSIVVADIVKADPWKTISAVFDRKLNVDILIGNLQRRLIFEFERDNVKTSEINNFINKNFLNNTDRLFSINECDNLPVNLRADLYFLTNDYRWINSFSKYDWNNVATWLQSQGENFVLNFIKQYLTGKDGDFYCQSPLLTGPEWIEKCSFQVKNHIFNAFIYTTPNSVCVESFLTYWSEKTIANIIINKSSNDDKLASIRKFPKEYALNIVSEYFNDTSLFDQFVRECWQEVKDSFSYAVFDLESDGYDIRQFACITNGECKSWESENQLNEFFDRLKKSKVIVGHNVKNWDLPILRKKGYDGDQIIWDTIEMEGLLNPCRYAYSLQTQHTAAEDAKLTQDLFWNQLYRLALCPELCEQLQDTIPVSIMELLVVMQQKHYLSYFRKTIPQTSSFFQEVRELDTTLLEQLKKISEIPSEEHTLIVAPQRFWNNIAQYVSISFPFIEKGISKLSISIEKLKENPLDDVFEQKFLERYVAESGSALVENIGYFWRKNHFTDAKLASLLKANSSHIDCVDVNALGRISADEKYQHIFFIGGELEERTHQIQLLGDWSAADLMNEHCDLLLHFGGTNYAKVTQEDVNQLRVTGVPEDVANIWIERDKFSKFHIWCNIKYQPRINEFKKRFCDAEIKKIPWTFLSQEENTSNLFLTTTGLNRNFNSKLKRVIPSSRYRAMYWTYQFKLLSKIGYENGKMPILYVVNAEEELEKLNEYACSYGFNVPTERTLFRRMEIAAEQANSLLIITPSEFERLLQHQSDISLCVVWDQMDIDKRLMMWNGLLPFENDEFEKSGTGDAKNIDATPLNCLYAAWPIFENKFLQLSVKRPNSKMFVLDPYLDDYIDLARKLKVVKVSPKLWENEEEYKEDLTKALTFFKGENIDDVLPQGVEKAIENLGSIMLDKGQYWFLHQVPILKEILQKEHNYLVSLPTGGGKSLLFQGPALYRSAFSNRLSIVVTPLKALMKDQVDKLNNKGFYSNVEYINSDKSYQEVQQIYRRINSGEIALLYITPERFRARPFVSTLLTRMMNDEGLEYIVFDETHCISQWGQEFRPDYLYAAKKCAKYQKKFKKTCVALFSATVTKQVENDIRKNFNDLGERLGQDDEAATPVRNHIGMDFQLVDHTTEARIDKIVEFIQKFQVNTYKSRVLIFCRKKKECEEVAAELQRRAENANDLFISNFEGKFGYFHAGMDSEDRNEMFTAYKDGKVVVLCATKAFGMGMDITNIHYVIHLSPTEIVEDYLQEVGRAGRKEEEYKDAGFRDGKQIPAICLCSSMDFNHLRELLRKSCLSWTDIRSAFANLTEYMGKFINLNKPDNLPVVVPFELWKKEDNSDKDFDDTTAFRLSLHWLERLNRIELGYLRPAQLNFRILNKTLNNALFLSDEGRLMGILYQYVKSKSTVPEKTVQIPINTLQHDLYAEAREFNSFDAIILIAIQCCKCNLLELDQSFRCELTELRIDEVRYTIDNNKNVFALHLVFEVVRKLLSEMRLDMEYSLNREDCSNIFKHIADDIQFQTQSYPRRIRSNSEKTEMVEYMPWYVPGNNTDHSIELAETFFKDLRIKRAKRIFSILMLIPEKLVLYKSQIKGKQVLQQITIRKKDWRNFVDELEEDCLRFLKYLLKANKPDALINWSEAIIELQWDKKGYQYFNDVLVLLRQLGYIQMGSLIPIGIQVFATENIKKEIVDNPAKEDSDFAILEEFNMVNHLKDIRLTTMQVFSTLKKEQYNDYIREYFKCEEEEDYMKLLGTYCHDSKITDPLGAKALKMEVERLEEGEQRPIYDMPIDCNINVIAGPGSGKTHILTLRCAKIIFSNRVPSEQLLVLAYNRAVVVELKKRLADLFGKLGLPRSAVPHHVFTFHAMAKSYCGNLVEGKPFKEWETIFYDYISQNPSGFRRQIGTIKYILVDEFQDITQIRLNILFKFQEIFGKVYYFTIGDKNQSIYGFDKRPAPVNPQYYYDQLTEKIHPKEMTMSVNHRSCQDILDMAEKFMVFHDIPKLKSAPHVMKRELPKPYTFIIDNTQETSTNGETVLPWYQEFSKIVSTIKDHNATCADPKKEIHDIAIFFRSNNEVYRGYGRIKDMNLEDVRIRIQGSSACETWRIREIFEVLHHIQQNGDESVILENNQTKCDIKSFVQHCMDNQQNWDHFYLDLAYTFVLNYLDSIDNDRTTHTYLEMFEAIKEFSMGDDGQLYKVYDQYKEQRILPDNKLNIILTTMHKVKGLEFDVVIITPSFEALPFMPYGQYTVEKKKEDFEEEKRLMFVAYTRAKNYLYVYQWTREKEVANDIEEMHDIPVNSQMQELYHDKIELDKLNFGFGANSDSINLFIENDLKRNCPLTIKPKYNNRFNNWEFYIWTENHAVGQLARYKDNENGSLIYERLIREFSRRQFCSELTGAFVSEIFVWTKEDAIKAGSAVGKDYLKSWSADAQKRGYIYLVDFAGYLQNRQRT